MHNKFKFKKGLVIGKFYPPHRGHKYLIETAKAQCEELVVILCWKKSETISGYQRADWLRKIHPDVYVKVIEDNKLADDDSKGWARFTLDILGNNVPDAVFTSESYGDMYASFMGSTHVLVDKARVTIPISATIVRKDPLSVAQYLEPTVRAYFSRRVCFLGAESTGTTTLSKAIANHYKTVWVPEYGRMYSEGKIFAGEEAEWRTEEFINIAKIQAMTEDLLAESGNGLVICDTDPFATSVWHERYMGNQSKDLEDFANGRSYDLYIVTGDEIPFVQDGLRDGEHIRHKMHERFIEKLTETNRHFICVNGSVEERLKQAIGAIDQILVK
jgi:HTH-type transcriptional regulator, transcriptional repressor of NAD biosynthesis genes